MKKINLIVLLALLISCKGTNCDKLPTTFSSYDEATEIIKSTSFTIHEKVNTSKSSWIRGAEYFSCNGVKGYFLLKTDSKDYIFQDMPVSIWENFKNAESFGKYYHKYIKGNYQFRLNSE